MSQNTPFEVYPGFTMTWPYGIAEGSVLAGTGDGTLIRVLLRGNVIDGTRPFVSDVIARRV